MPAAPDLRREAAEWCTKLSQDRAKASWSIRFTHEHIAASPATQLAWDTYCKVKARSALDTPPQFIWSEAAALLTPPAPKPPKPPPARPPLIVQIPTLLSIVDDQLPKPPKEPRVAKRQTRRTISVSRAMYTEAKAYAEEHGLALSRLAELALRHAIASGAFVEPKKA